MTDEKRAAIFRYQWGKPGGMHWAYNDMRECVNAWKRWGIIGMPDHTDGAEILLAEDLRRNEEWHATLRAGCTIERSASPA